MHLHEVDQEWNRQQAATKGIREVGAEEYFRSLKNIHRAFVPLEPISVCMDERIQRRAWRMGGSGILMPKEKLIARLHRANIQGLTTHEGCGAANLAAKLAGSSLSADDYAKNWAMEISQASGIPYVAHITMEEMRGPKEFHNATVAYYSGSNSFSAAGISELPAGFHINRKMADSLTHDLELALMIAFGDHGFGAEKFREQKFRVIALGNPNDLSRNAEALEREARAVIDRMAAQKLIDPELVDVDAFNVPNSWLIVA